MERKTRYYFPESRLDTGSSEPERSAGVSLRIFKNDGRATIATLRAKMTLRKPSTIAVYLIFAAMAVLLKFDPATTWWFPSCPFHAVTGLLCPFCGSLRALHALLQGAPQLAFGLNSLVTVGMTMAVGACVHDTARPTHATAFERLTALCFSVHGLAMVAAFGVLRNVVAAGWVVR